MHSGRYCVRLHNSKMQLIIKTQSAYRLTGRIIRYTCTISLCTKSTSKVAFHCHRSATWDVKLHFIILISDFQSLSHTYTSESPTIRFSIMHFQRWAFPAPVCPSARCRQYFRPARSVQVVGNSQMAPRTDLSWLRHAQVSHDWHQAKCRKKTKTFPIMSRTMTHDPHLQHLQ